MVNEPNDERYPVANGAGHANRPVMTEQYAQSKEEDSVHPVGAGILFLARMGYAAKGTVYLIVGSLAARAAARGSAAGTADSRGALRIIGDGPLGTLVLVLIALGLIGYALWRLISAVTDAELRGNGPKGLSLRVGSAMRGLVYGSLGASTFGYIVNRDEGAANTAEAWTARTLAMPAGRWLVILAGLVVVGYGAYQLYKAGFKRVLKHIDTDKAGAENSKWIERFGRFGIAARAMVFGMIGILLMRAAWKFSPEEAGGIDESLHALAQAPRGMLVLGVIAIGLVAYGLFQLATARYRFMSLA